MSKKIIMGFDQGGIAIKGEIAGVLMSKGYDVEFIGPADGQSTDYPDVARDSCRQYLAGGYEFGVLICGTGIGISIAANKIDGIRCALLSDSYSAAMARKHNNANFIAFGGRITYHESFEQIINSFVMEQFEAGRHQLRIDKIGQLEK